MVNIIMNNTSSLPPLSPLSLEPITGILRIKNTYKSWKLVFLYFQMKWTKEKIDLEKKLYTHIKNVTSSKNSSSLGKRDIYIYIWILVKNDDSFAKKLLLLTINIIDSNSFYALKKKSICHMFYLYLSETFNERRYNGSKSIVDKW